MPADDDLALAARTGLPDALRVLADAYPRNGWTDDPGFDDLIQFWLDRHIMFRRLLADMQTRTQNLLDRSLDPDRFAAILSRYGGMFVNGLHEHHTIEDTYYFPKLMGHDARLQRGFDMLETDHHAIDPMLADFVTAANAILTQTDGRDQLQDNAGDLHRILGHMDRMLDRHLLDEEDLIVPVILKFGSPEM